MRMKVIAAGLVLALSTSNAWAQDCDGDQTKTQAKACDGTCDKAQDQTKACDGTCDMAQDQVKTQDALKTQDMTKTQDKLQTRTSAPGLPAVQLPELPDLPDQASDAARSASVRGWFRGRGSDPEQFHGLAGSAGWRGGQRRGRGSAPSRRRSRCAATCPVHRR